MDALARLDEYLQQINEVPGQDALEKPRFEITTKEQALWALRKIASIERARKEAQDAARAEIERISQWLQDEELRANQARKYLDYLLEQYHRAQLDDNPKLKTIKLPHGELQLRAQSPEFVKEEEVLLDWAKSNRPEFVTQPPPPDPKLSWAELKKVLKVVNGMAVDPDTGEAVPGVTVTERPLKFQIKLSGV